MPYLLQMGKKPVHENISGVGLFTFPPGEPTEVKDEHLASVLLERMAWTGLTRVPEIRQNGLPKFDIEGAKRVARDSLATARKGLVDRYIQHQLETRVRQNMPPLPPSPSVQEIIEEDGYDLAAYGIHPVGWKVEERSKAQDQRMAELETANLELKKTNEDLREQNKLILERMDILMTKVEEGKKK